MVTIKTQSLGNKYKCDEASNKKEDIQQLILRIRRKSY